MLFFPPNKNRDPLSPSFKRKIGTFLIVVMCLLGVLWLLEESYIRHVLHSDLTPYEKAKKLGIQDAENAAKHLRMGEIELDIPISYFEGNEWLVKSADVDDFSVVIYAPDLKPKLFAKDASRENRIWIYFRKKEISASFNKFINEFYVKNFKLTKYVDGHYGLYKYTSAIERNPSQELYLQEKLPLKDGSMAILCRAYKGSQYSECSHYVYTHNYIFMTIKYSKAHIANWSQIADKANWIVDYYQYTK